MVWSESWENAAIFFKNISFPHTHTNPRNPAGPMMMRPIPKKDRGNGDRFNNKNRQPEKREGRLSEYTVHS